MNRLIRRSIVYRALFVTLLAFVLAGIVAIAYTSMSTGRRAATEIDQRLQQLLDTVHSTLKIACFLKDEDLAKEVALGLLNNPEVLAVTITADGLVLAEAQRTTHNAPPAPSSAPKLERMVASPFTPGKIVGAIALTPNPEVIQAQRRDDIGLAVQQLVWQLLLVSGAVAAALILFVVRPISRLAAALRERDPLSGTPLLPPAGYEESEIGQLVRAVNQLAERLGAALGEARTARRAAEAASEAKSQFLANMSHEIRTPLTAIQGFARIGARDGPDEASRQTFARILEAGNHLLGVINDILDFSRIEAGKMTIEHEPYRLADTIDAALSLVAERAREKGLELVYRPSPDLPEWVRGDAMRVRQILVNLLSNAIKFSHHGTVTLTALRAGDELWLAVRDEGIGMTPEEIARLFRPFEQADSSTTRKYGGSGLGLAISMNLASLMGGTIQVVSAPWQGSTFTLQLPCHVAEGPTAQETPGETSFAIRGKLAGFRVLAVEDIETNRLILADLLDEAGASYDFAENGRAAIERIVAAPHAYDVVLMDVQMPEMDGNEATRRIHAIVPDLPVIGLTAHGLNEDRATSLAAGMKEHITKPIDPRALITAILCWATPGRGSLPSVPPSASEDAPPAVAPAPAQAAGEVDWALLDKRFKGKRAFIDKLLTSALAQQRDAASQLRTLAAQRDFEALAFLAHSLKGVCGNLAASGCQALASAVDQAAKQRDAHAFTLAAELADRIERLHAEFRQHLAQP